MSDKKIEQFWRDATAADVARVMAGENVYARFRDRYADGWAEYYLSGVNGKNWIAGNFRWVHCQVYDPPQWWLDKPDPGEGYRLLEKFPDEPRRATDEAWNWVDNKWDREQQYAIWYRRRIEPVEPEPKHYVLRVGDSFETPSGQLIKVVSPGVEQIEFKLKAGFTAKLPNGQTITATEKGFEVKHD
jgi:hypothetical protein